MSYRYKKPGHLVAVVRGWLRRPSIAERVLRRTTKPTVAVDPSSASKGIVDYAVQLRGDDPPRLTVVHAARGIESAAAVLSPARWMVPEYRTYILEDARRQLEAVVSGEIAETRA